jgi:transcriptional regulator with XRE-family HTH domain/predicted transcriptional regulator
MDAIDPLIFGQRLRHLRKAKGLTLDDLGALIGRPAPFLSLMENGKREPRLTTINNLAAALGTTPTDLLSPEAPNERARLELAFTRAQSDPLYESLGLPHLKPGRRLPDLVLQHIVSLYEALKSRSTATATTPEAARRANNELRAELELGDNYMANIEEVAKNALAAIEYPGSGAVSQGMLTALAGHFGFSVHADAGVPASLQSVTDLRNRTIYVPQRDAMRTREVRIVMLRTLGHFVLGHRDPVDYADFLRQRVAANYFARAVLVPESAAVPVLAAAKNDRDLSIEDLKELFYVGYSLAAQRFANLITRHFGIRTHYLRSDEEGIIWRGWSNDGFPFPAAADGTIIGQRICRHSAARQVFTSSQKYDIHPQFIDTPAGTFFELSHLLVDDPRKHAVTLGTTFDASQFFRGRNTGVHVSSTCPEPDCCQNPTAEQISRWDGQSYASVHEQPQLLAVLPSGTVPGVDYPVVYDFLDARADG